MRQLLHLQQHRHTGKLLHHTHTSYRSLAVIFLLSGFFIASLNMASRAAADEFGVSAMVNVPVPTSPPIINSPETATTIKNNSLLVTGSCPLVTPQVVITVSVDSQLAGTAACDSNNDFSVPISMSAGVHKIIASVLTMSGQQGPTSNPVIVTGLATASSPSVSITANQPFIYADSKTVTWTGSLSATNQGDEHVHIDWGDGNTSDYAVSPGTASFAHTYTSLVSHNIVLDVASPTGSSTFEQFGAAALTSYVAPVPTPTTPKYSQFFETPTVLGLYGLYLTTLSIMGIIWLEAKHAARQRSIA